MPSCDAEAVDPSDTTPLCASHLADATDDRDGDESAESADDGSEGGTVLDALDDALTFFHDRLDDGLPAECDHSTPRDYFTDAEAGRGWDDETVDAKRLGYAPPDCKDELIAYLFERGYDRETILGTGLFYEDLTSHFRGRYVLPYFDERGRPVYAISRSAGHPRDSMAEQKYTKAVKTKDYSAVDEPIYGLDSIEDGMPVLVTEGIADAISAHEAGYPCVSPVTTSFKHTHREQIADALRDRDVPRVYVVNDAEPPTTELDEHGALSVERVGEGLRGALTTAETLAADGLDARVAELPRPSAEKVDLDDYLTRWDGDLTPVLASAKPVVEHRHYDADAPATKREAIDAAKRAAPTPVREGDGDHSALFDLDIRDVTGLGWDYRGPNPLGHHGDSENYFVLVETHGVAYDHKYKVAYNGLTYLLCDAGVRRNARPNGDLSDREIFEAWKHAKTKGYIPSDDPLPSSALAHLAVDVLDVCSRDDLEDGWRLPAGAYRAVIEYVDDDLGIEPGRTADGTGAEHRAILPNTPRKRAGTNAWDWRHAAEQDRRTRDDALTIDEARERTTDAIVTAYEYGDNVLVEALPTLGKSHGAVKAVAESDHPATILTGRGRKEQYEQFREWCDEYGLTRYTLPAFPRDCPTCAGEHGAEWRRTVLNWYQRGATPREIHAYAESERGRPLPCQEDGECPYTSAWRFDPDDYDVLIGHYSHAYNERVTSGRAVVPDEFPGDTYITTFEDGLQGPITSFLGATPEIPYADYTDLLEGRDDDERCTEALAWFDEHGADSDGRAVLGDERAHADAPLAVATILAADDLGNGWERAELGDDRIGLFNRENTAVYVLDPPNLTYARSVVALDGTPTREMWELTLGIRLNHRRVLSEAEGVEYLRDVLNYQFVRTTDAVKPYNSAEHVAGEQDTALFEGVHGRHGERPGLITTAVAEREYEHIGSLERGETGYSGPHVESTRHYGNVLGSNQYATKRVGIVAGSNHYGDDYIKRWGAFDGRAVEREDTSNRGKGGALSYGAFGDKVLTHMREHETLQAAMRFGRDGNGAVVYVHTNTLPEWVPIAGEGRVLRTRSDGERQVLDALDDLNADAWATTDVTAHPAVTISERQVRNVLHGFRERGHITAEYNGTGYTWRDDGLHRLDEHGDVELDPVELDAEERAEMARSSSYTWDFRASTGELRETKPVTANGGESRPVDAAADGPPPGPTD